MKCLNLTFLKSSILSLCDFVIYSWPFLMIKDVSLVFCDLVFVYKLKATVCKIWAKINVLQCNRHSEKKKMFYRINSK